MKFTNPYAVIIWNVGRAVSILRAWGVSRAVAAGIILTGSMLTHIDPYLRWTLAVIAGGGVAGAVQTGTVLTRAASTATTGGLGNPIVATVELGLSVIMSLLAVLVPFVAAILVLLIGIFVGRKLWKRFRPQVAS